MAGLHNIRPENVIFCYRDNDGSSYEVAKHYQSLRGLEDGQLIGLPCSQENVISQLEYEQTIEAPLLDAIARLEDPYLDPYLLGVSEPKNIWVIILGFHIPHAFEIHSSPYSDSYAYSDTTSLIAIASRLHRLGNPTDFKRPNFTYDRKSFKFFDKNDAQELFITAVIDGPTKEAAKRLIDRSIDVTNQQYVSGKLLVDPYGKTDTVAQRQYETDVLNFLSREAGYLGLKIETTTKDRFIDDDPTIASLSNESFYWGWFNSTFSKNLIVNQSEKRAFLYNADDDGAFNISRDFDENGSDPWPNLAINIEPGYAATAGSVEQPGEDAYLRPRPFFEAMHRGASLGECFLFSSRYIDWKLILIGDPLMTVIFPIDPPKDQRPNYTNISNNNEVIKRVIRHLENGLAYGFRQARLTTDINNRALHSSSMEEILNVFLPTTYWMKSKEETVQIDLFSRSVQSLVSYVINTTGLSFEQWLLDNNEKVTSALARVINTNLDADLIFPTGYWQYDFTYIHERKTLEDIYFTIEVSRQSNFSEINKLISSDIDEGWWYENELYEFIELTNSGFPSNYGGRRIRYKSNADNYLTPTETYYVRWRAVDKNGLPITDWQSNNELMIVAS